MPAYQVSIYQRFFDALNDVDESARPAVVDALRVLQKGEARFAIARMADTGLWTFDLQGTGLRIVCTIQQTTLILLFVGMPAACHEWAQAYRVVRLGNTMRVLPREPEHALGRISHAPWGEGRGPQAGPLSRYRRRQFARFGIGPAAAGVLRRLRTEDEVVELAELMTPRFANVVLGLATDEELEALERTFEQQGAAAEADEVDPNPARNTASVYTPTSQDALEAAIHGPPEAWAVYLHPQQVRAVEARASGAVKVVGGPGTGKTVVAVHRALFLAREVFAADDRPILLTVFSPMLTEPLKSMVDHLCRGEPALRERVQILDLAAAAQRILTQARRHYRLATAEDVERCWEHALAQPHGLGWNRQQFEAERHHVLGRNGAWTWEDYRDTPRQGRTVGLGRTQREGAWRVLQAFEEALADAGVGDELALLRHAEWVVRDGVVGSPYASIVCDEVQDASAAALRMLGALAHDRQTRQTGADSLYLVGDGFQRVYARPVSLVQCGIEVRGRSWILRLNYRSTEQIRQAAMATVAGLEPDVLESDDAEGLEGYRSEREGEVPARLQFASVALEAAWIAQQSVGGSLLVLTRYAGYRDRVADALRAVGVETTVLDGPGVPDSGVTVSTLHRSKGLEAPRVVIAGAHQIPGTFQGGDEADHAWWQRTEQCLLYVGMTRARDWLAITQIAP